MSDAGRHVASSGPAPACERPLTRQSESSPPSRTGARTVGRRLSALTGLSPLANGRAAAVGIATSGCDQLSHLAVIDLGAGFEHQARLPHGCRRHVGNAFFGEHHGFHRGRPGWRLAGFAAQLL